MITPAAFALDKPGYISSNTIEELNSLTLIPRSSSPGGVYVRHPKEGGMAMYIDDSPGMKEIRTYLAAANSGAIIPKVRRGHEAETPSSTRPDGRDVLEAAICTVSGSRYRCGQALSTAALRILHNEQPGRNPYPLDVNDGLFFSEVLGPRNELADAYHALIAQTLSLIGDSLGHGGSIRFECLNHLGTEIQKLDAAFALKKINRPQDRIHRCYGPSPQHPYSKITMCRSSVPVSLEGDIVPFVYEKFLVAYSYLDGTVRRSTVTPLHSHPLNFETIYFISYGPDSFVTEQEFQILGKDGSPLIMNGGTVNTELLSDIASGRFDGLTLKRGDTHHIYPSEEPALLLPFELDAPLAQAGLIRLTDGLFRPHQVTVHDDHNATQETLYYAMDNYFGPVGKVFIYDTEIGPNLWSHDDWER